MIASFAALFLSAGIFLSTVNFARWIRCYGVVPLIVIELAFFVYFLSGKMFLEYMMGASGCVLALVYTGIMLRRGERVVL